MPTPIQTSFTGAVFVIYGVTDLQQVEPMLTDKRQMISNALAPQPGHRWEVTVEGHDTISLLRRDTDYIASTKGVAAAHFRPEVAVAGVLALGPRGRTQASDRASALLDMRGAVPYELAWTPECWPGSYMLKIIRGDIRR